jgi:FtsP/CotA-like multicopper oxidase with cupredoxin domain
MNGHRTASSTGRRFGRALLAGFITAVVILASVTSATAQQVALKGTAIPRFVEPMPMPLRVPATETSPSDPLEISMNEFQQQLLPASMYAALPAPYNAGTYLWCYKAAGYPQTFPGPTLEARVGVPTTIKYTNNLVGPGGTPPVLQGLIAVDQTLHWADPLGQHGSFTQYSGPVPAVTHLHGGEVPSAYDGGPDAWWTPGMAYRGPGFVSDTYTYPNEQEPTTLWYHDHALGATRTNVYAGLAGFYLLRDPAREPANLPGGSDDPAVDQYGNPYEREIVIQDRMFDTNGQLYWPSLGINPTVHPFWGPEFFGDVIMVNGKTWPYLQVEPRRYRFRMLNGSNARFYELRLASTSKPSRSVPGFWQIGSDGGLLDAPVLLNDPVVPTPRRLLLAPGERVDLIVDFAGYAGQVMPLLNSAKAPFPQGAPADPKTTGTIMQIRVGTTVTGLVDNSFNPAVTKTLRAAPIERPTMVPVTRALTLNENMGPLGPLEMFVNNTMWAMGATETPAVGSTEVWEIINLTADTHPIHLHLVQFQLINRQAFNTKSYAKAYGMPMAGMGPPLPYDVRSAATGNKLGGNPDITPHLSAALSLPEFNERGWKDTFRMNPGEVTRVLVRVAPQDANARAGGPVTEGMNLFAFDPTAPMGTTDSYGYPGGPGYVWHCHIIDHEDNEMMRQMLITNPLAAPIAALAPAVENSAPLPAAVTLAAAKPNPTTGSTRIGFTLPSSADVELVVYDLAGREVSRLADGRYAAGEHAIAWNGQDRDGRLLPNGTYLYRLRTASASFVRKLVLVH